MNSNLQLTQQGLLIRYGKVSIIDASVIKAKQNRPNKGREGKNTQDPEANSVLLFKLTKNYGFLLIWNRECSSCKGLKV